MNRMFKRHSKGEKGFTLVELLIVFTLLAVLAAILIPNVGSLIGYGHTQAAAEELAIVQTAMDSMMAVESQASVTAAAATSDMAAFPDATHSLYPDYVRQPNTHGTYSCDTTGNVTRATTGY
jgi:prepilin-type N-terminal cleavage/methylation domain-containing protein